MEERLIKLLISRQFKEIAEIHNQPLGEINRRINENRKHFTDGKDVIDLKGTEFEVALTHNGIFTQNNL